MNQPLPTLPKPLALHDGPAVSPFLRHKGLALVLIGFGLSLFLSMWASYRRRVWFSLWDEPVLRYFKTYRLGTPEWLTTIVQFASNLGNMGLSLATMILLSYWLIKRQFRHFWLLFTSVAGVELLWLTVTFLLGRTRPREIRTVFSILLPGFPSGHVMTYIAFASTLLYLYISHIKNQTLRILIAAAALAWMFITGWIRLYFSSHYITDILGGYGLGIAWTVSVLTSVDYYFFRTRPRELQKSGKN
ncbi:MAG: phosphatase PAP2 family protein [Chloroflexi bacterium]|nr:phosphatase PAP2 family protein [Chloroflexota bacterium]MBP8057261.1 phosphatase PAP2 family protein [Chloroflexota bacterium]